MSGEFTKVVQRVPVRIWIEKDDRWPQLQAGLSVRAVIDHGPGDPEWAKKAAQEFADLEGRYNGPQDAVTASMTRTSTTAPQSVSFHRQPPASRGKAPWLAAVAIVPILATVFQTFVLTDVTDDVIRKGLEAEHYAMIWPQILWGIGLLYGVFTGIWASSRYGARDTLLVGLGLFAVGNVLCGAALDVSAMTVAKLVEGIGKGMVIVICRSLLYRQFDRLVIVAIGFYGMIAYATRPTTPLLTSFINDVLWVGGGSTGSTCRWPCWRFPWSCDSSGPTVLLSRVRSPSIGWRHRGSGLGREHAVHGGMVPEVGRLDVQRLQRVRAD